MILKKDLTHQTMMFYSPPQNKINKKVTRLMEHQLGGKITTKVVALGPKK